MGSPGAPMIAVSPLIAMASPNRSPEARSELLSPNCLVHPESCRVQMVTLPMLPSTVSFVEPDMAVSPLKAKPVPDPQGDVACAVHVVPERTKNLVPPFDFTS